jgi:lysophospholipase L1-like esterase
MRKLILSCCTALALVLAAAPARAVVTGTTTEVSYTGNSATTAFPFSFKATEKAWVKVTLAGVVQANGFTVTLNTNQDTAPGGTVTFAAAPASGVAVTLRRVIPIEQRLVYRDGDRFPAKATERGLDHAVMLVQQIDTYVRTLPQAGAAEAASSAVAAAAWATAATTAKAGAENARASAELARDAANATGRVYPDTAAGLAAVAEGEYFNVPSGATDESFIFYRKVGAAAVEVKRYPSRLDLGVEVQKNKFNSAAVLVGYEVRADGSVMTAADSVASDFIDVAGQPFITISGMEEIAAGSGLFSRFCVYLAADKSTIVGTAAIPNADLSKTLAVPAGAHYFRFSPQQRSATTGYSLVQVEHGSSITAYEPHTERLISVNARMVGPGGGLTTSDITPASRKNLFDPAAVTEGWEVFGDGTLHSDPTSSVSGFIDVAGATHVSVSGLQVNPGFSRYWVFLAANQTTIVGMGSTGLNVNAITVPVPAGAAWFRFSPRQRNASGPDYATVQVEHGIATAFEAFTPSLGGLRGRAVGPGTYALPSQGLRYLLFGDSITRTHTVSDDGLTYTLIDHNWPSYFAPMVRAAAVVNYAKSSATYRDRTGLGSEWEKISYQVTKAIEHGKTADVIIVSAGTNDGVTSLGTYATAMSKASLAALDRTNLYEALRWTYWQIRTTWPNAVCFAVLPIQRAATPTEDLATLYAAIEKMARQYNIVVVPATWESGIVREFETVGVAGRDLLDGLHPNTQGKQKLARLIARYVQNTYNAGWPPGVVLPAP